LLIYCTDSYRTSLNILCKSKKLKYYGCLTDTIDEFLSNFSFEEIWGMNYHLRSLGNSKLSKIRLPNSTMQKGKSGGFRLIILLDKKKECVNLLFVYPKVGPNKRNTIQDNEEIKFLKSFRAELKEKKLEKVTLNNKK